MTDGISLSSLTKRYGDLTAVDDLTLHIPTGQIVALLGPNRAGKSTTTEMILGLTRPTSGDVTVAGVDPITAVRRSLTGAMLQNGTLLWDVTVSRLLRMLHGLYDEPVPLDEVIQRADISGVLRTNTNKVERRRGTVRQIRALVQEEHARVGHDGGGAPSPRASATYCRRPSSSPSR